MYDSVYTYKKLQSFLTMGIVDTKEECRKNAGSSRSNYSCQKHLISGCRTIWNFMPKDGRQATGSERLDLWQKSVYYSKPTLAKMWRRVRRTILIIIRKLERITMTPWRVEGEDERRIEIWRWTRGQKVVGEQSLYVEKSIDLNTNTMNWYAHICIYEYICAYLKVYIYIYEIYT